jgi:hypothetical protein
MAAIDHTAHARPSVRKESASKPGSSSGRPFYPLSPEQAERQSYVSKLAGITLAVVVIQSLLERSECFQQSNTDGKRNALGPWPFTFVQVNGLKAAMYFLQQYADTLSPDSKSE